MVTLTNFLGILGPKEVKSVFSFLYKTIFKDVRVGVLHNVLFISFFFDIDFFPQRANQGRKLLASLVVVNVESLSTNTVKGKY